MTGQWKDYGGEGTELVPAGLRGYREFAFRDKNMGGITSPQQPFRWNSGLNVAGCPLAQVERIDFPCDRCREELEGQFIPRHSLTAHWESGYTMTHRCYHTARYQYQGFSYERPLASKQTRVWVKDDGHPAPHKRCACGLYATYRLGQLQRAPGISYVHPDELRLIGVVEASGRTILGTKGFRAEKMRVVAMALRPRLHPKTAIESASHVGRFKEAQQRRQALREVLKAHWQGVMLVSTPEQLEVHFPPNDVSEMVTVDNHPDDRSALYRLMFNYWMSPSVSYSITPTTKYTLP